VNVADYTKIASRYDDNGLRHDIPKDETIGRLYAERGASPMPSRPTAC
jgi:hypothetical protein